MEHRYAKFVQVLSVPTNLVNFGQAVNFPLLFGATLALFGVVTLAHLLLASVSRRRREFALLKALGFVRRQLHATIAWQATTVAIVGIVIGVPIGIATGTLLWQAFASSLGAVPVTVVPFGVVALTVVGVLIAGNLLAIAPATVAARARSAVALREE